MTAQSHSNVDFATSLVGARLRQRMMPVWTALHWPGLALSRVRARRLEAYHLCRLEASERRDLLAIGLHLPPNDGT